MNTMLAPMNSIQAWSGLPGTQVAAQSTAVIPLARLPAVSRVGKTGRVLSRFKRW
jgi:hypothetical protein